MLFPSIGVLIVMLSVMVAGVMSFASGICFLCKGKKFRGAFLMAAPVIFCGYLIIHLQSHPRIVDL